MSTPTVVLVPGAGGVAAYWHLAALSHPHAVVEAISLSV